MADVKTFLSDAIAKLGGERTSAERKSMAELERHIEQKQKSRELQHQNLPDILSQFDIETLPKEFLVDPASASGNKSKYDQLRVPAYRAAANFKNPTAQGLESLPAKDYNYWKWQPLEEANYWMQHPPRLSAEGLYGMSRAMAAAKPLGVPQLSPEMLAGLYLKEGRTDLGANSHDYKNPQSQALFDELIGKYNADYRTANFLVLLKEKQALADRLKIPFGTAWIGTGKSGFGETGAQYAPILQKQIDAAQRPENAQLLGLARLGIEHGTQYPYIIPEQRQAYLDQLKDKAGIASLLPGTP